MENNLMWESCSMVNSFYARFLPYLPGYKFDSSSRQMTWKPSRTSFWLSSIPLILLFAAHAITVVGFYMDICQIPLFLAFSHFCSLIMIGSAFAFNRIAHAYGDDIFLAVYNRTMFYDRKMFQSQPAKTTLQRTKIKRTLCNLLLRGKSQLISRLRLVHVNF